MLQFYDRINISNPEKIADTVIMRLKRGKHINRSNQHYSQQNPELQNCCLKSIKMELSKVRNSLNTISQKVEAYETQKLHKQKLLNNKSFYPRSNKRQNYHIQNVKLYPTHPNYGYQRSYSWDMQNGSAMKKILYSSESPQARIRANSSRSNYDELYHKQERRIAQTLARSPEGRSKIKDLIIRDKNKFYC